MPRPAAPFFLPIPLTLPLSLPLALTMLVLPLLQGAEQGASEPAQNTPAPNISSTPSISGAEGPVNALVPPPLSSASSAPIVAPGPAPVGNRYDILSKMITPLAGVMLGGAQTSDRALTLRATVDQVAGRLPKAMKGASFKALIQYPGRIRIEAPVLGETLTVCRNGNEVWAMPGSKIQFLLGQFQQKPRPQPKNGAPVQLPFTAQQAVLLPALFQLERTEEVAEIDGYPCRIVSGGLIPEVAKAANAQDFSAKLWICSDYSPKRIDIRRSDFAMSFLIGELSYAKEYPPSTWQPPAGATDVYKCDASQIEQLLYVLMNSLQMTAEDKPWLNEAAPATAAPGSSGAAGTQGAPLGPMR